MEFGFRAGDRGASSSASGDSPPAPPLSTPRDDYFGGPAGPLLGNPPQPLEWEAARREEIIRREVQRRLIEEEVRREFDARGDLAFAHGHHGGFGPADPFFPPGDFMPPPMPMPMHPPPHAPMPFEHFGPWQGFNQFGPRPHAGFGARMPFRGEERSRRRSPPRPKPKHKLQLREIEPSGEPETSSSKTKVLKMKRKADTIVGPTVPKKLQKLTKDWSCAVCKVTATCEAGLNEHLEGRKHKAKFAQCGASKVTSDGKNNSRKVSGNKSVTELSDAPMKICILVDGAMHEVVQKNNYMWCDRCKVRCDSNMTMAGHLQSKKHSKLNKVWTSIEAVRTNNKTNEGLVTPCENKVNTDDSTEKPVVMRGDIDMAMQVAECGPVENPVEIEKESRSMTSEVESTSITTEVQENSPETLKESTNMTNDVSQLLPKEE